MYHLNIPGSEIESWVYWEYEKMVEILSDVLKKKQAAESKGSSEAPRGGDPTKQAESFMRKAQQSTPKMPNMGGFKFSK